MYKLTYRYKGKGHTWTNSFSTKADMEAWKKTFKPFVYFRKEKLVVSKRKRASAHKPKMSDYI